MTAYTVNYGQTSSGIILHNGDTLTVLSGGKAIGTKVLYGGRVSGTVVSSGGLEFISSAGTVGGGTGGDLQLPQLSRPAERLTHVGTSRASTGLRGWAEAHP